LSLSDHVTITITADTLGVPRAGFGVPMVLSATASFPERIRFYDDLAGVAADFPVTTSAEYLAASAIFSQNPHPERMAIGRAIGKPTQKYRIDVSSVSLGATYGINVKGKGVTATECRYTTLADITFTATNATELFTSAAHGMSTGDGPFRVSNSGGALPTGLSVDTDYWIIADVANGVADPVNTYQMATSRANALAGTELLITSDGTGTQTLRRNQNDVICAQLLQDLNATVGKNFTAVQQTGAGETDFLEITGTAAGDWFSLEVTDVSLLKNTQTHVEPATTFATDLANISNENNSWYALITLYNSEPCVKAAAAYIEAVKKMYFPSICDSEAATLASAGTGNSDCADDLKVLGYKRTAVVYHPSPAAMLGAAWLGTRLPYTPGSETWKFASPSGVSAYTLTSTHKTNLRAKNVNTIESLGGTNRMWEGKTASGQFIDVTRGLDWLEDDMQVAVYNALAGALKVPYTDAGIALIQNAVVGSLQRAVQNGLLAADPEPVVTVPKASAVATADKTIRTLPDVKFSGTLAGAVHKVVVTGVVSV
jgi:hypothetical protein